MPHKAKHQPADSPQNWREFGAQITSDAGGRQDLIGILGIDAAWTAHRPSGVSVIAGDRGSWRLIAVASSYGEFYQRAGFELTAAGFDAKLLLDGAARIGGARVDLIAADIPLAHSPIIGRRASDNAVSRLYGARHAGTHTPSATRPGALADRMRVDFLGAGYALQTAAPASRGLIEVYPHPALIELAAAPRRLEYKIGKAAKYWPGLPVAERRDNLLAEWRHIIDLLDRRIAGVADLLRLPASDVPVRILKGFEDALDAVICGWIGTCVIEGTAVALGGDDSAIWVPMPQPPQLIQANA